MIADCKILIKKAEEEQLTKHSFPGYKISTISDNKISQPSFLKRNIETFRRNFESLNNGWADNEDNIEFSSVFLERIGLFLENLFERIKSSKYRLLFPSILPVDGNSIDVHWKTDEFQLLINIPEFTDEGNQSAVYGRKFDYSTEINFHGDFDYIQGIIWEWLKTIL